MIEINGKVLFQDDDKLVKRFERLYTSAWNYAKSRYGISTSKGVRMFLDEKFKADVIFSKNADGTDEVKMKRWPAGIMIPTSVLITVDGIPYQVRYYRTKRPLADGKTFLYDPRNITLRNDIILREQDKELLMFYYLFSPLLETKPKNMFYDIDEKGTKYFKLEDRKATAEERVMLRTLIAKATVKIDELSEAEVRRFASIVGIGDAESEDIFIIKDQIIKRIEETRGELYDELDKFTENKDDSILGFADFVKYAKARKAIVVRRNTSGKKSYVTWHYVNDDRTDGDVIHKYDGRDTEIKNLTNYLLATPEAYEDFKLRLEDKLSKQKPE